MKLSIILALLLCLVLVQYHAAISLDKLFSSHSRILVSYKVSGKYKCAFGISDNSGTVILLPWSVLKTDQQVLESFPYFVPINPKNPTDTETYALMNENGQIIFMNIINQHNISAAISCLNHLRELNIGSTHPYRLNGHLSTKIERLPLSLIFLKIYDTKITQWPDNFGELTELKTLELSNIGLISPLDDFGHVTSLGILYLLSNRLTILPPTITNLRSLEQIILTKNAHLRSIQELNGLPSLKILDVRDCSIERLPLNLPNLIDLYITNNSLTNLIGIETLGTGTNYNKYFYFGMNKIKSISSEIRNVSKLYRLNMDDNELEDLPADIYNVTTLRYLSIKHNCIDDATLTAIISKMKAKNPSLKLEYSN